MSYIATTLDNLIHQTAFFNLTGGNIIMIFSRKAKPPNSLSLSIADADDFCACCDTTFCEVVVLAVCC